MKTFFATFGQKHRHSGRFVEIVAEDHHAARFYMIATYAADWSQQLFDRTPGNRRRLVTVYQKPGRELSFTLRRP